MKKAAMNNSMEKIVSLAKRRGFIYPGSEIYGGLANSYDYGPLGAELKNNIKQLWWKRFVQSRDDVVGIDAALIMSPKVWEASGHLKEFSDPIVECKRCHERFRFDNLSSPLTEEMYDHMLKKHRESYGSTTTFELVKKNFTEAKSFNLMLKTFLGPVDPIENLFRIFSAYNKSKTLDDLLSDSDYKKAQAQYIESLFYLRPETAQAMFVDFKNVLDTTRKTLPFGIAQIGKAFRNEITPGNFIFRTREFEQMEIEYFVRAEEWEKWFEYWREEMFSWMKNDLGLDIKNNVFELDVPDGERAHYSKKTIDFEYEYPFGREELYGLAYRTDFDLKNHFKEPPYRDPQTGDAFYPHVIEPTWGVDRSVLAVLCDSYKEEKERILLKLPPRLAPYKAAVFPLLKNKPDLVKLARKVYDELRKDFMVDFDDRGNIGKRYYSQDEIGTPYCITVDFESLEKSDVTVRDRDTMKQERIEIDKLKEFIGNKLIKNSD